MSESTIDRAELIRRLRQEFQAPESLISDDELLRGTQDTIARRTIELGMALDNAISAVKAALPAFVRRLFE